MSTLERSATVLVVDDDHDVRLVTGMLLQRAGYEVLAADDGARGVQVLEQNVGDVDVVLLDVIMPGMTGHEALPRMRELRPDLPVIFFSGYGETEVASHLTATDAYTSFLSKPADLDALATEIARALEHRNEG